MLLATARDVRRNYAVAAWAVRKHLDYVSAFRFQSKTGDKALDERIERFVRWWSLKANCDVARRHPLRRLIRLGEAHRTVDGDTGVYKLMSGRIQVLEGDHIANATDGLPPNVTTDGFEHGVKCAKLTGEALRYMICDRAETGGGLVYRAIVPARHLTMLGYYDRLDQVRGISPLASALNTLQDTYETVDHAVAKAKVAQMFGLALFRTADDSTGDVESTPDDAGDPDKSAYKVDFGRGPFQLDLDPEDKAEFLEARTPAQETMKLIETMILIALKALDIPHSFFDESFTNFYGSRGGLMQYLHSCRNKQDDLIELLDELTAWRLAIALEDAALAPDERRGPPLDMPAGMAVNDLAWGWTPAGVPWWDPKKEIDGHLKAIAAGLDNPQRVCQATNGTDFYENIDRREQAETYARDAGVAVDFGLKPAVPTVEVVNDED